MFQWFAPKLILVLVFLAALIIGAVTFVYFEATRQTVVLIEETEKQPKTPTHTVIGQSVEGRSIDAYTYGNGNTRLFFVGGMHGGYEWNSVLLAYTFKDYLDMHPEVVPEGLSVIIIPAVNPDGVYKIIGKEGQFIFADVPMDIDASSGRFNAHDVDLNRNFDCNWQPESAWKNRTVSAGSSPFSEPESRAIRDFVLNEHPVAAIFWHSQANAVYASECNDGILLETMNIMNIYANAAGYPAVQTFDAYKVTGDSEGWLASIGIPAITVELKSHDRMEWDQNLKGFMALMDYYSSAN